MYTYLIASSRVLTAQVQSSGAEGSESESKLAIAEEIAPTLGCKRGK